MSDAPIVDRSKPVRKGEELDLQALDAYLGRALPDLSGELVVEQFPSGYSNLTYLLRKGDTELVLRRPPFNVQVKSGHDMSREFKVLRGLSGVYAPAPEPLAFCEDDSVLGASFYLMERRNGIIVRRKLPDSLRGNPELFKKMCHALIDNLADLHAVDVEQAGLSDLGRPQGYVERQVEGWIARWKKAQTSEVKDLDAIGEWLRKRMPADSEGTLVHNDYKFDNVMLDAEDPTKIVAVLDWEMCTQGDPLMDLGTTLGYWLEPGDDPVWLKMAFVPSTEPGAPTRRQLADRYAERTGRDVSNMIYYYCFALLKIAVIVQQIYYRFAKGYTKDPRFAQLDKVVEALARTAVGAAQREAY